jgi:hypothetical protein
MTDKNVVDGINISPNQTQFCGHKVIMRLQNPKHRIVQNGDVG